MNRNPREVVDIFLITCCLFSRRTYYDFTITIDKNNLVYVTFHAVASNQELQQ